MTSQPWFSVDARAHLRKLTEFHHHRPTGFILDLVRSALSRGALRVNLEISPGRIRISDNGSPLQPEVLSALESLARPGLAESRAEERIHELMDPPGMGLLALFAPRPRDVLLCTRGDGGTLSLRLPAGQRAPANREPPGGMETEITLRVPENVTAGLAAATRRACRAAPARISINGGITGGAHLLKDAFLIHRVRGPGPPAVLALPLHGETCRLVFTFRGIPWEEMFLPPQQGLVFQLQLEQPDPPGDELPDRWIPAARRLYALGSAGFADRAVQERSRLEELFFLLHQHTGDTTLFREAPLFPSLRSRHFRSLAQLQTAEKPLRYRLQPHDRHPGDRASRVLFLTSRQLEFLTRLGLPMLREPDPLRLPVPASFRWRSGLRRGLTLFSRWRYAADTPLPPGTLGQKERLLVDFLSSRLARPAPGDAAGEIPPVWNPVILNRRGCLPLWPGPRMGGFNFRDLVMARHHPAFRRAADLLAENSHNRELVAARFRPFIQGAGVRRKPDRRSPEKA